MQLDHWTAWANLAATLSFSLLCLTCVVSMIVLLVRTRTHRLDHSGEWCTPRACPKCLGDGVMVPEGRGEELCDYCDGTGDDPLLDDSEDD